MSNNAVKVVLLKLFVTFLLGNSLSHGRGLYERPRTVDAKPDIMPYTSEDSPKELMAAKDYSPKSLSEAQNGEDDSPKEAMASKDYYPKNLSKRQNGEKHDDSLNLFEKTGRRAGNSHICSVLDRAIKCIEDEMKPKLCSLARNCEYMLVFGKEPVRKCVTI